MINSHFYRMEKLSKLMPLGSKKKAKTVLSISSKDHLIWDRRRGMNPKKL